MAQKVEVTAPPVMYGQCMLLGSSKGFSGTSDMLTSDYREGVTRFFVAPIIGT